MKKSLLINILIIVLVAAVSIGATYAYFSGQDMNHETRVDTAKIAIDAKSTAGFPLIFQDLLPGDWVAAPLIEVQNTGDAAADFYIQLIGKDYANETNFCTTSDDILWIKIQETGPGGGTVLNETYYGKICYLYPYLTGAVIPKLANDVPAGQSRYFKVSLYLATTAGNEYADAYNQDLMNFIAVQYNGPAPAVDNPTWPHDPWPVDDADYD